MASEEENDGSNSNESEQGPQTQIQVVNPLGPAGLAALRQTTPSSPSGVELEGEQKNAYDVLAGMLGLQNKDAYAVMERTIVEPKEIPVFRKLMFTAEHGIGGDLLDIPVPELGETVVNELRLRRSKTGGQAGQSSAEFERVMSGWLTYLRQREDLKLKENQRMVS